MFRGLVDLHLNLEAPAFPVGVAVQGRRRWHFGPNRSVLPGRYVPKYGGCRKKKRPVRVGVHFPPSEFHPPSTSGACCVR